MTSLSWKVPEQRSYMSLQSHIPPPQLVHINFVSAHNKVLNIPCLKSVQTPDRTTNLNNMIHKKKSNMARKWKKLAAIGRKIISFTRSNAEGCHSPTLAHEGCFVIYSIDRSRFVIPLVYLSSHIFQKLLEMSEEEYGLSSSGPIIMPCDSVLLENVLTLIERGASDSSEKALLDALSSSGNIQQLADPVC